MKKVQIRTVVEEEGMLAEEIMTQGLIEKKGKVALPGPLSFHTQSQIQRPKTSDKRGK